MQCWHRQLPALCSTMVLVHSISRQGGAKDVASRLVSGVWSAMSAKHAILVHPSATNLHIITWRVALPLAAAMARGSVAGATEHVSTFVLVKASFSMSFAAVARMLCRATLSACKGFWALLGEVVY